MTLRSRSRILGDNSLRLVITFIIIFITGLSTPMTKNTSATVVSELTGDSKSTTSTALSSASSGLQQRGRKKWNNHRSIPLSVATDTFKGANAELRGKVFVKGASKAAKYDEAYKALVIYFGTKYDHRVYRAFENRDADIGRSTIVKPVPPMVDKIVQEATLGEDSKMRGR